jgi:hypothetical protein
MLPTAHIASALLLNRLSGLDEGAAVTVLGSQVPDAIDKTLAWILRATPAARHIAHTPLAAIVLSLGASALLGRRKGMAAYLAHLVGDLWDDGHVPWLMPFKRYDEEGEPWSVKLSGPTLMLEALGAATILLLARAPGGNRVPEDSGMHVDAPSTAG